MENENITILHPEDEVYHADSCDDCEETSICNCENQEIVTPCEVDFEEETAEESHKDMLARKCREVKDSFRATAARLANDWKETNGNPYIKQTCITQVDIYRNPDDETPIDSFRTEQVKSYSARSLAVLGAAALVVACTVDSVMKKLLK